MLHGIHSMWVAAYTIAAKMPRHCAIHPLASSLCSIFSSSSDCNSMSSFTFWLHSMNEAPSAQKHILIRITKIKLTALHLSMYIVFRARFQLSINWVISLWFSLWNATWCTTKTKRMYLHSYRVRVCLNWEIHVNFVRNGFSVLFCWAFNFVLFPCRHTRFSFFLCKKGLANLSHSHLIHRLFCDFDNGSRDTIHINSQINLSSNRKCVCALGVDVGLCGNSR